MDYKKINRELKNLNNLRSSSKRIFKSEREQEYSGESFFEVYDIGLEDGFMVKLTIEADSYGEYEIISGVEFVKGKEKVVTIYEY